MQNSTMLTAEMLLQTAIKAGNVADVQSLIQESIEVNHHFSQGITPLHAAVISNQESIVLTLLQAGAEVDARDLTTEATPLHLAALYGREAIAAILIAKGANINAQMKFGITPLLVATQFKNPQMVQLLINNKANINHADEEGFTALHFAAQNGNIEIAKVLIEHGAELSLCDKTHKATPMKIATDNNHPEIVQLLQEREAILP